MRNKNYAIKNNSQWRGKKMKNIIGRKVGMTQIFDEKGSVVPVTVIEAGPCNVVQVKTVETDGYNAVQLGFGEVKENKVIKVRSKTITLMVD